MRGTDHRRSAQAPQRYFVTLSPPAKPQSALLGTTGQEGAGLWTHRMSQSVPSQSMGLTWCLSLAWGCNMAASWVLHSYSWKEVLIALPILSGVKKPSLFHGNSIATIGHWFLVHYFFFFFSPPFYVALCASKARHRFGSERVSWCLETSPPSQLPPRDGSPSLTLSSLFIFYILPYLLSKRIGCLSGCLVSSTSVQKLFCGSCSAFKWFFDEFVRDKVVSLSYFPATLGNLLNFLFNTKCYLIQ